MSPVISPSSSAPNATASLMIEQGLKPAENASGWFTTVSMRPVSASTTTTLPLVRPNACTATARTAGSSPSMRSFLMGFT